MYREYALDPNLLSNWKDFRYYIEKFSWDQGRLIAEYPKKWKKLVYRASEETSEMGRKRIVEVLSTIDDRLVSRPGAPHDGAAELSSWLRNACAEHSRLPFCAVIAAENPDGHEFVLVGDDLSEDAEPRWRCSSGLVPRDASRMAGAVALLLRCASRVVIVDPHFKAHEIRYRRPLEAFLKAARSAARFSGETKVELLIDSRLPPGSECAAEEIDRVSRGLPEGWEPRLRKILPAGVHLKIKILRRRPGGEKIHNRYILTEHGAVMFGIGLDDDGRSPSNAAQGSDETDDIQRLGKEQHRLRWQQYSCPETTFDVILEADL